MTGIYKIENLITHRCYIGQSRNIQKRWLAHKNAVYDKKQKSYDYPIYRAIRKYGIENFSFEIIEQCPVDELNEREKFWIKHFSSYEKGYNQTPGGESLGSHKLTLEQVREIKQRLINFKIFDSHQKIAQDYNVSDDTIQAINNGNAWFEEGLNYPLHISKYVTKKQENFCIDCGKPITIGSIRCNSCNLKKRRMDSFKKMPLSREELKNLIRNTPFTTIGKLYGVTDNAIRKWCKKYDLPQRVKEIKQYSDLEWEKI